MAYNAMTETQKVERESLEILRPFIKQRAFDGRYVVTNKGPLSRELQRTTGDLFYNSDNDTIWAAEIKAERSRAGRDNFFLETWSNRKRFTVGWMFTLNTDLLLYHFLNEDELYCIPFGRLRQWAFIHNRIYEFEEKPQRRYEQPNDTWGRCVPIIKLTQEMHLGVPFTPKRAMAEAQQ